MDVAGRADVEGFGRIEGAGGNQHRGHADQRVKRRDKFRHRGHRYAARDHRADAAADRNTEDDEQPGEPSVGGWSASVVADRDRHADHAEADCPAASRRAR